MPLLPDPVSAAAAGQPPARGSAADVLAALRAKAALVRKRKKTPLEDALAAGGGTRAVGLGL